MAASTDSMCSSTCKQTPSRNSIYRKTHVTALKFYDDYILVGEGHTLELFNLCDLICIQRLQIFKNCNIHGIVTDSSSEKYLAIYGAKSLVIAKLFNDENVRIEILSPVQQLEDWIWDVQWLHDTEFKNQCLAVALAHNSVICWNWKDENSFLKAEGSDKCILYCGKLIGKHLKNLIFAAGTVFKEVVIWAPCDISNNMNTVKPLHRLQGHEGIIFSITFNSKLRKLSTTSDDRVVRIWKFCTTTKHLDHFNDINLSLKEWKNGYFELLHNLYGHEARVWTAALLPYCVLSVGEDSTICFWNYDGKLIRREKCHSDGSIWSLTVNSNCTLAATGGSDGGVILWHLKEFVSGENATRLQIPQNDDRNDFPRNIGLLFPNDQPVIFMSTNEGMLFSYSLQNSKWKQIFQDKEFYSYNILACSPCGKLLIFGNITGKACLFQFTDDGKITRRNEIYLHKGKIHNLLWITKDSNFILSCGPAGEMILWKLRNSDECDLEKQSTFILPLCKQRWMSAALLDSYGSLVLGDRDGNIYVYNSDSKDPNQKFHHIHSKNGVTDIKEHKMQIFSSGRDGRIFVFKSSNNLLQQLHSIKITTDMEWIGKIDFYNNHLLLMGFHTTNFVVWDLYLNQSLMEISCGGGHRSWDFSIDKNYNSTFACIRKNEVFYGRKNIYNIMQKSIVKKSLWGRELCCILFLFHLDETTDIFACGGEDNSLMIIKLIYDNSQNWPSLELVHCLHGHVSSIRAIKSIQIKDDISVVRHLLVSLGGRAQILIWEIKFVNDILTCYEIANNQHSLGNKLFKKPWIQKNCAALPEPQTRYLDACLWEYSQKDVYMIAVACSDAVLRFFRFSLLSKELQLYKTVPHGNYCILHTSLIYIQKSIMVFTGSTDGLLKIFSSDFNIKENTSEIEKQTNLSTIICPELITEKRLHQCGINAMCLHKLSDSTLLLFTGGDDNSLNSSVITVSNQSVDIKTFTCPTAHYAQITGISVLSENKILTASIDQRIHLWNWGFDKETKKLNLNILTTFMSCIPDIACLDVYKRKNHWIAVVCGQGLEAFSID